MKFLRVNLWKNYSPKQKSHLPFANCFNRFKLNSFVSTSFFHIKGKISKVVTTDDNDHAVLLNPAKEVTFPLNDEIRELIADMYSTFRILKNPAGLAATQIGASWQVILFQVPPEAIKMRRDAYETVNLTLLINPSYKPLIEEGSIEDWEGCYSLPDMMGKVPRFNVIHYQGQDINGKKLEGIAKGFLARVIQHEVGHLKGELYKDLVKDSFYYGTTKEMQPIKKSEDEQEQEVNINIKNK